MKCRSFPFWHASGILIRRNSVTYLDNAASAPMHPEVLEAVYRHLKESPTANPTGAHLSAQKSRKVLNDSREQIADICGVAPGGVVFLSGGTEANNLAIFGTALETAGQVVCSAIEHPSVLMPIQSLGGKIIKVQPTGELDLDDLAKNIDETTRLISVMMVNNEVGVIQPLKEIARLAREKAPNALLHTDAAQAMLWLDIADAAQDYDLLSLSAHKFGGPMGIGALIIRSPQAVKLHPQLLGGQQEQDRRSGTQNVPAALGMAAAAAVAQRDRAELNEKIRSMRDRLQNGLVNEIPDTRITAEPSPKIPNFCHICIDGIESESLLFLMTEEGIEASAASSCASGAEEPSYVLAAMGYPEKTARGSLRLTLGAFTTDEEVDKALQIIPRAARQLRDAAHI